MLYFLGSVPWCGDDTLTPLPFITISVFLIDYCAFRQTRCYELIRDPCRARGLILFPPCTRSAGAAQEPDTIGAPSKDGFWHSRYVEWGFSPSPQLPSVWDAAPCQMAARCQTIQAAGLCGLQLIANLYEAQMCTSSADSVFRLRKCLIVQWPNAHMHTHAHTHRLTPALLRRPDNKVLLPLRLAPIW